MNAVHFILYTADQDASTAFYARVLDLAPQVHVPGMTEFALPGGAVLGLMPVAAIRRLLGDAIQDPGQATGIPRSEIYLLVDDADLFHRRALASGARELSPVLVRNWGHLAGYSLDPDGHVLAFAQVHETSEASSSNTPVV